MKHIRPCLLVLLFGIAGCDCKAAETKPEADEPLDDAGPMLADASTQLDAAMSEDASNTMTGTVAEAAVDEEDSGIEDEDAGSDEPTLLTTEVSFSGHCCSAPPDSTNLITDILVATVSDAVEYPAIQNSGTGALPVIPADIDMSQAAIDIVYTGSVNAAGGAFNGYRFDFAGDAFTRIVGAELGPESTTPVSNTTVMFDEDSVFINVASLQATAGARISVLLTLE